MLPHRLTLLPLAVSLLFASSTAIAGDPCPIAIRLIEVGPLPWANAELRNLYKDGDPFFRKLESAARTHEGECGEISTARPGRGPLPLELYDEANPAANLAFDAVLAKLVDDKRRFQCDQADRATRSLKKTADVSGAILYLRGHSRIILVSPGWTSLCVSSKKAASMNDKEITALWKKVSGPLVKDRHDNP